MILYAMIFSPKPILVMFNRQKSGIWRKKSRQPGSMRPSVRTHRFQETAGVYESYKVVPPQL